MLYILTGCSSTCCCLDQIWSQDTRSEGHTTQESGYVQNNFLPALPILLFQILQNVFFSCVCLLASMARSVNCLGRKKAVQVHLIGAKPIVQVKR